MTKIEVLDLIITDVEKDMQKLEGAPFTGKNVAEHFGYLGAQVQSIAKILKAHLEEEHSMGQNHE